MRGRPGPFGWLNLLTVALLGSGLLALFRLERALALLVFFPFSPVLFLALPSKARLDSRRADVVSRCRWHLLFAIPSTRSIRAILLRKREHLAHIERMQEILAPLLSDLEIGGEILAVKTVFDAIEASIRAWPIECSALETLNVPALGQLTEIDAESGVLEE